jgi:hypothetical protein
MTLYRQEDHLGDKCQFGFKIRFIEERKKKEKDMAGEKFEENNQGMKRRERKGREAILEQL